MEIQSPIREIDSEEYNNDEFVKLYKGYKIRCVYLCMNKGEPIVETLNCTKWAQEDYEKLLKLVNSEERIYVVNMIQKVLKEKKEEGRTIFPTETLWDDENDLDYDGKPKTPEFMLAKAKQFIMGELKEKLKTIQIGTPLPCDIFDDDINAGLRELHKVHAKLFYSLQFRNKRRML